MIFRELEIPKIAQLSNFGCCQILSLFSPSASFFAPGILAPHWPLASTALYGSPFTIFFGGTERASGTSIKCVCVVLTEEGDTYCKHI
jgi:hypothetical protein